MQKAGQAEDRARPKQELSSVSLNSFPSWLERQTQLMIITLLEKDLAAVTPQPKDFARTNVAYQRHFPHRDVDMQVSSCRECMNLSLSLEGISDNSCVQCDPVNDPLRLVTGLKEEV